MRATSKLVILGLVQNNRNKFLICQRHEPQLPEVHLKWDLPGGTNEAGESPEDTLKREILEETGLQIKVGSLLPKTVSKIWDYPDRQQETRVLCFYCRRIKGKLCLGDHKISGLKWVDLNELKRHCFLSTTGEFIKLLENRDFPSRFAKS